MEKIYFDYDAPPDIGQIARKWCAHVVANEQLVQMRRSRAGEEAVCMMEKEIGIQRCRIVVYLTTSSDRPRILTRLSRRHSLLGQQHTVGGWFVWTHQ